MSNPKETVNSIIATQSVTITGTKSDDTMTEGYVDAEGNVVHAVDGIADKVNGNSGSDTIVTSSGNDLTAGDMVGNEWSFVNGKWVYNPAAIVSDGDTDARSFDDTIFSGSGDDVVLGNGGDDLLFSGAGSDTVNAGTDDDTVYGGSGDDVLNLEDGDDLGVGGAGADTINAGAGDDLVYGDFIDDNVLTTSHGNGATSFTQYDETGDWTVEEANGQSSMSQTVETKAGESYTITFELAANLGAGATNGTVEVLWNGTVVGEVSTNSGVYQTHSIEVKGTGADGELTFRSVDSGASEGPAINTDGPIFFYDKEVTVGGENATVAAFAPGQAKLYQVIDGQLKVFDTAANDYQDAGPSTGLKVNAIGFNVEDDLIYGVAKKAGVDTLGNAVSVQDLVMMDAQGNAYRIGKAPAADYVGDFDGDGNLWTFNSSLDRVSKVDVDNLDASGNPTSTEYNLPNDLFEGRAYDIAYNAAEKVFYAVESPSKNGGDGAVHRIDFASVEETGEPVISSIPITGTLYGEEMQTGLAKGAYGAVFLDGEGNLYYGLNKGDHDLDAGSGASGAIFKVNMDWGAGTAYSEFMSDSQSTGSNDGAVDPRSSDAFAPVDQSAPFLIRNPEMTSDSGGNDNLRGGAGNDVMYGGGGDDVLHGGTGNDRLSGDHGDDKILGGSGDDVLAGGAGKDALLSGTGDDQLFGGAGNDFMHASIGNDIMSGGEGTDRMIGAAGNDILHGDAGNDVLNGGSGNDTLSGDQGDDRIVGASGDDVLAGGAGKDALFAGTGDDQLFGGEGNDFMHASIGNDTMSGGEGTDKMIGAAGNDILHGDAGNDVLNGGSGNDTLSGDHGDDRIVGASGDDVLAGGTGKDALFAGTGDDQLFGGAGNDFMHASIGDDTLSGGQGDDRMHAAAGNDLMFGGDGSDFVHASTGDDILSGGAGTDKLIGGIGSDTLEGGAGNDHLWGGNWWRDGSSDTFIVSAGDGKDMIHDFETSHDQIDLSSYGLNFQDLQGLMSDKGWATEIDLSGLDGAGTDDKLILKSVHADDLDESNFIL